MTTFIDHPPSPTLSATSFRSSVSWNKKSPSELIPMLKNAYKALKEKERDLKLAAEIGKSLLENNLALKTNYEDLLNTPYPTPSNSYSLIKDVPEVNTVASQEEDSESESGLRYIPTRTREALVEILEEKNAELSEQLELVLQAQTNLEKSHKRKACQLEKELEFLRSNLENATAKIQELEDLKSSSNTKNTSISNTRSFIDKLSLNKEEKLRENEDYLGRLQDQVDKLQQENQSLNHSKVEAEDKLNITLHDLCVLKEQYQGLEQKQNEYDSLKNAHKQQFHHSLELESNLEEHETILQKFSKRGTHFSPCFGTGVDFYDSQDDDYDSDDDYDDNSNSLMMEDCYNHKISSKHNLLAELGDAWFNDRGVSSVASSYPSSILSIPNTQLIQSNSRQFPRVNSAIESIYSRAQYVGEEEIDDALSLIGRLEDEYNHGKFLEESRHKFTYHPSPYAIPLSLKTARLYDEDDLSRGTYSSDYMEEVEENRRIERYYGSTNNSVSNFLPSVLMTFWKWCRFILVMTMAIIISLKDGPQS
ncbi:hypothetical protein K501DRAFT_337837 [Backusella circina FSU 941]|nr:hypothetical protein K501DRAFT_327170 [Backusella circina FSU 941]KAI8876813.1 hypothetical protein K501DRAFT_337837 [Backusella circina FSU 941]